MEAGADTWGMKATHLGTRLRTLRDQAHWKLLAADDGPWIIALLHTLLGETERKLPVSVMTERLGRALDELHDRYPDILPGTAQRYLAVWLANGWLVRTLAPAANEEELELSLDALQACRYVTGLGNQRLSATESRLATVMARIRELADRTDPNPERRIASLNARIRELEAERAALVSGEATMMDDMVAAEGVRDILLLVEDIPQDFHRVRERFVDLNRDLRQRLVEHEGSRARVLEDLFAGKDLIADSEEGRTFAAFWNILKDPDLQDALNDGIEALLDRPFARRLARDERLHLGSFFGVMLRDSLAVLDVHRNLSDSLLHFVKSNTYLENKTVSLQLKQALQAAGVLAKRLPARRELGFSLTLTTTSLRSLSQLQLHDPATRVLDTSMVRADAAVLDPAELAMLVRQSDIRFHELRQHIRTCLKTASQVSIAGILERFPASQGLASIVGYLILAEQHGVRPPGEAVETVRWTTHGPGVGGEWTVTGRIPACYFVRGCEDGFRE